MKEYILSWGKYKPKKIKKKTNKKKIKSKGEREKKLTTKQVLFIEEYLSNGFNASQAAKKAGYSKKTARKIGQENLTKPDIRKRINERINEILKDKDELIYKTVEEFKRLGFSDIKEFVDYDNDGVFIKPSDKVDTRPISEIVVKERVLKTKIEGKENADLIDREVKLKMYNKIKALEGLSRYLDMWVDRIEHTGKDGKPIEIDDIRQKVMNKLAI